MAIIDRIKYNGPAETLVWKWRAEDGSERDNLVLGSQLIVNASQEALFFKGGRALDLFGPGTHTLSTANIPIFQKLINLPFGGKTPFSAEIFYVNKTSKLDYKWGTRTPIMVEDPKLRIAVSVGCFGQFGLRVADSGAFVTQIVGTLPDFSSEKTLEYFRGIILQQVQSAIGRFLVQKNLSILQAAAFVKDISAEMQADVQAEMAKFGVELLNFYISAINIAPDELRRIQEVQQKAYEFDRLGDQRYAMMRGFDTMQAAAENSGAAGGLMSAGLGVGMGVGMAHNVMHNLPGMAPLPGLSSATMSSPNAGASSQQSKVSLTCASCGTAILPDAKFCGSCGKPIPVTSTCVQCGSVLPEGANFCGKCGTPVMQLQTAVCPGCGVTLTPGAKFCSNCGKNLA